MVKLKKPEDAANLWAFISSLSPAVADPADFSVAPDEGATETSPSN